MKRLALTLPLVLSGVLGLAQGNLDAVSFAKPGGEAIVRLELRLATNAAFNRPAPNLVRLENPFKPGQFLERREFKGIPWPDDAEHYFQSVDPLEFRLPVSSGVKAGTYPLKFSAELFVCDKVVNVCFKRTLTVGGELRIGASGRDVPGVLEVGAPDGL